MKIKPLPSQELLRELYDYNQDTGEFVRKTKKGTKKIKPMLSSSYRQARVKGTKNKTGIKEAYEDRNSTGFNYNNFMLQRWVDHNGDEQRVRDCFERNRILIDLTAQPDEIKELIRERISQQKQTEQMKNVGIHFMKFCAKWSLQRMSENPTNYASMLNGCAK